MSDPLVLIIEDDPLSMKLVRDVLTLSGCRTLCATSAEEGVDLARLHRPDVVVLDIGLPGMDGHAALGVLRADRETAPAWVIAVTAGPQSDSSRFLQEGFDDFLAKPIDVHELARRVRSVAAGARRGPS